MVSGDGWRPRAGHVYEGCRTIDQGDIKTQVVIVGRGVDEVFAG
jgi:hypothetical protein